jgi:hypothetical protein
MLFWHSSEQRVVMALGLGEISHVILQEDLINQELCALELYLICVK